MKHGEPDRGRPQAGRPFLCGERAVIAVTDIGERLWEVRRARLREREHAMRACDYLDRATNGMSMRRATDWGGTGTCPLTDYAMLYVGERDAAKESRAQAEKLWRELEALVGTLHDLDARLILEGFYREAMSWDEVRRAVKRSGSSVDRLHREALRRLTTY